MPRSRLSAKQAKIIQTALQRYRHLAVSVGASDETQAADEALAVLQVLVPAPRQPGRPRTGAKRGLRWQDDPKLDAQIGAILRGRRRHDSETLTDAVKALKALARRVVGEWGKTLTKAHEAKLQYLATRPNVESREIGTYILAWRSNVRIRQAKRLRKLSAVEVLFHA